MLPLFYLDHATVVRHGGDVVFRELSWTLCEGETWAVVGPVGAGKTALTDVLLGRLHVESGEVGWPLLDRLRAGGRAVNGPGDVIKRVAFKDDSWLFSYARHYYQQRFNFIEPQDDLSLDGFLRAGTSASDSDLDAIARRLGIDHLRELSLIKLSNGQVRRARIARALLGKPELLILDDPFLGLDAAGRAEVASMLGGLVRGGLPLLVICRADAMPEWVTHVLELDRLMLQRQGPRGRDRNIAKREASIFTQRHPSPEAWGRGEKAEATPIIEMNAVNVAYGERRLLCDVSWMVRAGERWAVLGPNGSGKSTLLSLIAADHPQAYSNDIRLFDRQRGSGESIWEIKSRIGLVSPELHLYFSTPLTARQAAATGFFDVLVPRRTTAAQDAVVREWLERLEIADLADRPFASLSTGEQRLVLLARALVKSPPLLILDEPFQGLDDSRMRQVRDVLDRHLRPDQTVLFVTHYPEELPASVTRLLRLEAGRVVEMR